MECGEYQWPEVQAPCPEVQIKQKHDHTPQPQYLHEGWDTVVDCNNRQLTLSCMPYIPVQYFRGYYAVDQIPYDPADTSFHAGTWLPITSDDVFCGSVTTLNFPFFFFGIQKTGFVVGSNGLVTFDNTAAGQSCPWSMSSSDVIPWSRTSDHLNDAIFGIYEDTHPITSYTNNASPLYQGIWYGVQDEWPCRKIVASWNDVPQYPASSNTNNRCTYQIVCYEGSNIIEVHIKQRSLSSTGWNGLRGIVGILNDDGSTQTAGSSTSSTRYVINGSPAAFFPTGMNQTTSAVDHVAYRFTPQGFTAKADEWFRILDNGDTVQLRNINIDASAADDTNGYYYPMEHMPNCPTLTRAIVSPTCVSRYVYHLKFRDANQTWYNLYDTIVIGVDTANDLTLRAVDSLATQKVLNVCAGSPASLTLEYPKMQVADSIIYSVFRRSKGQDYPLDINNSLNIGPVTTGMTSNSQAITLNASLPTTGVVANKIDSVYVQVSINFTSGCQNYDTMLISVYPNFDTTTAVGICQGETYVWSANNRTYTTSTQATEHLQSTPGCDSTVHLDLTVYDKSYTIDHIYDCQPYTWINGITYDTTNSATAASDTILLPNQWGCDSVVQLEFTMLPVVAHIQSDRDFFDFDHLDAVLTDISENNDSRTWMMPGGVTMSGPTAYYTIPAEYDSADIWLVAQSPYGCVDSTHIVIPMRKETFWLPNVFIPGSTTGNNLFGSTSTRTTKEEMYIYNRTGMLVFHCDTPDCAWDGKDMNGNPCPQGTYMYFIRYSNEFLPKITHVLHGSVTLLR